MLILTRHVGERIRIGDSIVVSVERIDAGRVRLGFEAPDGVRIDREEVRKRIERDGGRRS